MPHLLPRFIVAALMMALIAVAIIAPYAAAHGSTVYYALFRNVCHQNPHRCFELFGFPMAICARCTLIYFGIAIGALFLPTLHSNHHRKYLIFLGIAITLVGLDVACGYLNLYESSFVTRSVTGFLFGLPLGAMSARAVSELLQKAPMSSTGI